MLYRKGEHVVLQQDGNENVCKVDAFFCIEVTNGKFQKFVKAIKYPNALDEDENPLSDPYSGGLIIDTTVMQVLIAPVTAMLRKVMLYDLDADPHGRRIVLDFQRESMPITSNDILVPFFPQVQDMILIKGDDPDPWLAKVLTIQERAKTCKIWYYMEDTERPGQQL